MKFPITITVSNKKNLVKMAQQKCNNLNLNNNINRLASARQIEPQMIKEPHIVSDEEKRTPTDIPTEDIPLNVSANLPWLEEAKKSELIENFDKDGKLFSSFKRISLDRSLSWDDSGFNSCTSDDRDDISDRLSFDLALLGENEDETGNTIKKISHGLHRSRSYSLDSESSDLSDSYFRNSRTSLSPACSSDLERNIVSLRDSNAKRRLSEDSSLMVPKIVKRNQIHDKNQNGKLESTNTVTDINVPRNHLSALRPVLSKRRRAAYDHNNNGYVNGSIIKNLKSYQRHSSPHAHTLHTGFQEPGFLSLMFCIIYTLFLGFVVGVCGLLVQAVKLLMSKEDVQDLRESISRSRFSEKQSNQIKIKEKNVVLRGRKLNCK